MALQGALYDVLEAHPDDPAAAAAAVDAFARERERELAANRADIARHRATPPDEEALRAAVPRMMAAAAKLQARGEAFARRAPAVVASPEVRAAVARTGLELVSPRDGEPETTDAEASPWPPPEPPADAVPLGPEDAAIVDELIAVTEGYYALLEAHGSEPARAAELGLAFLQPRRGAIDAFHARRKELEATDPEALRALQRGAAERLMAVMRVAMRVQRTYPALMDEPKAREALKILNGG